MPKVRHQENRTSIETPFFSLRVLLFLLPKIVYILPYRR